MHMFLYDIGGGRASLRTHGKSRAAREDWSPMEPPAFPPSGLCTVRAAPGSDATLVLPVPTGTPPFNYQWSRAGAALDERFAAADDAAGVRLTVTSATTGDTNVYTLQASNAAGSDTSRVRLEVCADEAPTGEDPPTFLRRLQDLTVKVGTRTRFLVEIVSSTECKVTWFRNERRLLEAERVALARDGNFWCADVAAVSVDDAGRWTCTAENAGGRASCSAHLNVLVPKAYKRPEFMEELRALLTEQGTVSLECKVVGVPTPVLRWFKDSREIKAGDVFALTANAEDPTSLGTYTCEAVNCMGRAYSSSKVHVVGRGSREGSAKPTSSSVTPEPPPIFTKELEDQFVRICEPLTLGCHIVVPPWPRSVVWYNKEGKIEPSERYHVLEDGAGGYLLELPSAEWPDEGEWKCVATSTGGRVGISTCYVTMDVPKNYRKPRFMENLQAVLTEEGLVSFECKVVGFPTPVLSWFKDGQELKPGDVYQLTGTNSLGSYCCIARNCMGQASSSAELTVEDIQNQLNEEEKLQLFSKNQAPKFIQGLKSVEAKIDEPFRFTVKVAIPPEPSVLWYRDDQPVDESSRCHHGREDRGVFYLDIQSLEFLDQAEWKCVAMNDFGHSVTSCFLKLIIPRHYKKPRFLENLQAILSDEGAVNLECKVIGVPQPILKWYKDGEELKPGDIHRIISGQDGTCCLGTYTCEAQNCMGIAASSASLLGFDDSMKAKKKKAEEQALQRNLSLSTIHEERTSQMYDTPVGDITTLDDKGEISFSFDGKEVSVSLYETPDLTEEEALQIVEMYADQLSENITEHNVVELPPLRFVKETSTSGNLLMEAVIIDVSPEYFVSPDEDMRTEADIEEISIADENGPPQLSLDQDIEIVGEDYLEKTMAMLTEEKSDISLKFGRKKSDSQRSADDFYSLSREQSLSEEKRDDDTQAISDLQSFASAHSLDKPKSKSSKPSGEDGQESSEPTKTILLKDEPLKHSLDAEPLPVVKPKIERRTSRTSRRSSSGSEKSITKSKDDIHQKIESIDMEIPKKPRITDEEFKDKITSISNSLSKIINDIQIIERDIILKSELMSSAATASRSLEIISSLISPLTEIHSIVDAAKESVSEPREVSSKLFNSLPKPLKTLHQSLTIIEKCIDMESDSKTLVRKTSVAFIETCGIDIQKLISDINFVISKDYLLSEDRVLTEIESLNKEMSTVIKFSADTIKARNLLSEASEIKVDELSAEVKHLRDTQKAVFELKSPLLSLLCIAESADSGKITDVTKIRHSEVLLNDMSGSIQDLQTALEQIETLSVKESDISLRKYNTEIIESVMESVVRLRSSFEQLSTESEGEDKDILNHAVASIKENLNRISSQIEVFEKCVGTFDILQSENKLDALQKMAQILIALENNLPRLESLPEVKKHMTVFHKNLTKVLENVIESNESKKYFTLMEVCDAVNRVNSSIKNLDIDPVLPLASLNNTLRIIQDQFITNVFDSELNCFLLTNIADTLIAIQEAINVAEEISMQIDSEHIKDIVPHVYDKIQAKVVVEHIDHAIAAIKNVESLESTKDLNLNLTPALEKICPVLEELKRSIASLKASGVEEEHISDLTDVSSFAQTLATPLCELNQNIIVLNQNIVENIESLKENSQIMATIAEPLHELHTALEILQQDVISQYGEDLTPYDVNITMASAVQNLQSCIVMIQEHAGIEAADDMSTLEDISGIKTTANTLASDRLMLPTAEETAIEQTVSPLNQQLQITTTAQALQTLNEHITVLQTPDIIDALDSLSEVSDFSSLKSFVIGLGELHSGIEEVLHPLLIERSNELGNLINPSKLTAIAEPMQELQQSLSVLDTSNIPIYENLLEMPTEKIHSVIQTVSEFKEHLDKCMLAVFPALHTADNTMEIANKVGALREVCEHLKDIIETTKALENIPVAEEVKVLEHTIDSLLDATDVSKGINIEDVKSITEKLYEKVATVQEEIIQFTPHAPEKLAQEAKLIQTIDEVQSNIAVLEQYDFVDLSRVSDLTCTSPQMAIEIESDSLMLMEDIVDSAVNVVQDSSQDMSLADIMIVEDFFKTCKNEFTILRCLISKATTHKKIIRLLQEFSSLQSTINDFKTKRFQLNLSEDISGCLATFLIHAEDCLQSVQTSLLKIVDSQVELLIEAPLAKFENSAKVLNAAKEGKHEEKIIDLVNKFDEILVIAKPTLQNVYADILDEIKSGKAHIVEYSQLVNRIEEFESFVETVKNQNKEMVTKDILDKISVCIEKHHDFRDASGTGKTLILLKCLSDCTDILEESLFEVKIPKLKIEKDPLKAVLTEMLEPLQALHSQLSNVQEQVLQGVDEDLISVDISTTESLVQTMTEKHQEMIERMETEEAIANEEINLIMEVDKEIHSIQDSLRSMESVQTVVKKIAEPVENIEKSMHDILSSEKLSKKSIHNEDKVPKEKAKQIIQHIDQYIDLIEIVEEISAIIQIDNIKETMDIARELRESIAASEIIAEGEMSQQTVTEVRVKQTQLAQKLQTALSAMLVQVFESAQELAPTLSTEILQRIAQATAQLQADLVVVTGVRVALQAPAEHVLEIANEIKGENGLADSVTTTKLSTVVSRSEATVLEQEGLIEKLLSPEQLLTTTEMLEKSIAETKEVIPSESAHLLSTDVIMESLQAKIDEAIAMESNEAVVMEQTEAVSKETISVENSNISIAGSDRVQEVVCVESLTTESVSAVVIEDLGPVLHEVEIDEKLSDVGLIHTAKLQEAPRATKDLLIQHIDQFTSDDLTEVISELSHVINTEELKQSISIAKELRENIAASEFELKAETSDVLKDEVKKQQAELAQQLYTALAALSTLSLDSIAEIPSINKDALLRVTKITENLRADLTFVAMTPNVVEQVECVAPQMEPSKFEANTAIEQIHTTNEDGEVYDGKLKVESKDLLEANQPPEFADVETFQTNTDVGEKFANVKVTQPGEGKEEATVINEKDTTAETTLHISEAQPKKATTETLLLYINNFLSAKIVQYIDQISPIMNFAELKQSVAVAFELRESMIDMSKAIEIGKVNHKVTHEQSVLAKELQDVLSTVQVLLLENTEKLTQVMGEASMRELLNATTQLGKELRLILTEMYKQQETSKEIAAESVSVFSVKPKNMIAATGDLELLNQTDNKSERKKQISSKSEITEENEICPKDITVDTNERLSLKSFEVADGVSITVQRKIEPIVVPLVEQAVKENVDHLINVTEDESLKRLDVIVGQIVPNIVATESVADASSVLVKDVMSITTQPLHEITPDQVAESADGTVLTATEEHVKSTRKVEADQEEDQINIGTDLETQDEMVITNYNATTVKTDQREYRKQDKISDKFVIVKQIDPDMTASEFKAVEEAILVEQGKPPVLLVAEEQVTKDRAYIVTTITATDDVKSLKNYVLNEVMIPIKQTTKEIAETTIDISEEIKNYLKLNKKEPEIVETEPSDLNSELTPMAHVIIATENMVTEKINPECTVIAITDQINAEQAVPFQHFITSKKRANIIEIEENLVHSLIPIISSRGSAENIMSTDESAPIATITENTVAEYRRTEHAIISEESKPLFQEQIEKQVTIAEQADFERLETNTVIKPIELNFSIEDQCMKKHAALNEAEIETFKISSKKMDTEAVGKIIVNIEEPNILKLEDMATVTHSEEGRIEKDVFATIQEVKNALNEAKFELTSNPLEPEILDINDQPLNIKTNEYVQITTATAIIEKNKVQMEPGTSEDKEAQKSYVKLVEINPIITKSTDIIEPNPARFKSTDSTEDAIKVCQSCDVSTIPCGALPLSVSTETASKVPLEESPEPPTNNSFEQGLIEQIDEFISEEISELVNKISVLTNSKKCKESIKLAKALKESIEFAAVTAEINLLEEVKTEQAKLMEKLQDVLSILHNKALEKTEDIMPAAKPDVLQRVSEVITHLQEALENAIVCRLPDVLQGAVIVQIPETEENSMKQLEVLLQEITDKVNVPTDRNTEDTEALRDALDEVQTVIIKLKRDYDGTANDTLNETLEDLECSVRSVQLQINEDSPPELLKEACATLQLLVNNMNETKEVKVKTTSVEVTTENILEKCATESDETVKLLELASKTNIIDSNLAGIVSSLNILTETIKTLKLTFMGNADVLIQKGVDVLQSLDQLEDKVFMLEKDLSEVTINTETRDHILTAVHSVYGSISNMRGTISSIQKRYMFENYGKPSETLLRSIKNVSAILDTNEGNLQDWKAFSKSLRKILNHFEDIKFYINLDKTARLPGDAAFTKIILEELKSNICEIMIPEASNLGTEAIEKVNYLIQCVHKNLAYIESKSTLEVKEKIPIFKELSSLIFAVTDFIRAKIYEVSRKSQPQPTEKDVLDYPDNNENSFDIQEIESPNITTYSQKSTDPIKKHNEIIDTTKGSVEIMNHKKVEDSELNMPSTSQIVKKENSDTKMKEPKTVIIQEIEIEPEIETIASELVDEIAAKAIAIVQNLKESDTLEQAAVFFAQSVETQELQLSKSVQECIDESSTTTNDLKSSESIPEEDKQQHSLEAIKTAEDFIEAESSQASDKKSELDHTDKQKQTKDSSSDGKESETVTCKDYKAREMEQQISEQNRPEQKSDRDAQKPLDKKQIDIEVMEVQDVEVRKSVTEKDTKKELSEVTSKQAEKVVEEGINKNEKSTSKTGEWQSKEQLAETKEAPKEEDSQIEYEYSESSSTNVKTDHSEQTLIEDILAENLIGIKEQQNTETTEVYHKEENINVAEKKETIKNTEIGKQTEEKFLKVLEKEWQENENCEKEEAGPSKEKVEINQESRKLMKPTLEEQKTLEPEDEEFYLAEEQIIGTSQEKRPCNLKETVTKNQDQVTEQAEFEETMQDKEKTDGSKQIDEVKKNEVSKLDQKELHPENPTPVLVSPEQDSDKYLGNQKQKGEISNNESDLEDAATSSIKPKTDNPECEINKDESLLQTEEKIIKQEAVLNLAEETNEKAETGKVIKEEKDRLRVEIKEKDKKLEQESIQVETEGSDDDQDKKQKKEADKERKIKKKKKETENDEKVDDERLEAENKLLKSQEKNKREEKEIEMKVQEEKDKLDAIKAPTGEADKLEKERVETDSDNNEEKKKKPEDQEKAKLEAERKLNVETEQFKEEKIEAEQEHLQITECQKKEKEEAKKQIIEKKEEGEEAEKKNHKEEEKARLETVRKMAKEAKNVEIKSVDIAKIKLKEDEDKIEEGQVSEKKQNEDAIKLDKERIQAENKRLENEEQATKEKDKVKQEEDEENARLKTKEKLDAETEKLEKEQVEPRASESEKKENADKKKIARKKVSEEEDKVRLETEKKLKEEAENLEREQIEAENKRTDIEKSEKKEEEEHEKKKIASMEKKNGEEETSRLELEKKLKEKAEKLEKETVEAENERFDIEKREMKEKEEAESKRIAMEKKNEEEEKVRFNTEKNFKKDAEKLEQIEAENKRLDTENREVKEKEKAEKTKIPVENKKEEYKSARFATEKKLKEDVWKLENARVEDAIDEKEEAGSKKIAMENKKEEEGKVRLETENKFKEEAGKLEKEKVEAENKRLDIENLAIIQKEEAEKQKIGGEKKIEESARLANEKRLKEEAEKLEKERVEAENKRLDVEKLEKKEKEEAESKKIAMEKKKEEEEMVKLEIEKKLKEEAEKLEKERVEAENKRLDVEKREKKEKEEVESKKIAMEKKKEEEEMVKLEIEKKLKEEAEKLEKERVEAENKRLDVEKREKKEKEETESKKVAMEKKKEEEELVKLEIEKKLKEEAEKLEKERVEGENKRLDVEKLEKKDKEEAESKKIAMEKKKEEEELVKLEIEKKLTEEAKKLEKERVEAENKRLNVEKLEKKDKEEAESKKIAMEKKKEEEEKVRLETEKSEKKEKEEAESKKIAMEKKKEEEEKMRLETEKKLKEEAENKRLDVEKSEKKEKEEAESKKIAMEKKKEEEEMVKLEIEKKLKEEAEKLAKERVEAENKRLDVEKREKKEKEEAESKKIAMEKKKEEEEMVKLEIEKKLKEEAEKLEKERVEAENKRLDAKKREKKEKEEAESKKIAMEKKKDEEEKMGLETEKKLKEEAEKLEKERVEAENKRLDIDKREKKEKKKAEKKKTTTEKKKEEEENARLATEKKLKEEAEKVEKETVEAENKLLHIEKHAIKKEAESKRKELDENLKLEGDKKLNDKATQLEKERVKGEREKKQKEEKEQACLVTEKMLNPKKLEKQNVETTKEDMLKKKFKEEKRINLETPVNKENENFKNIEIEKLKTEKQCETDEKQKNEELSKDEKREKDKKEAERNRKHEETEKKRKDAIGKEEKVKQEESKNLDSEKKKAETLEREKQDKKLCDEEEKPRQEMNTVNIKRKEEEARLKVKAEETEKIRKDSAKIRKDMEKTRQLKEQEQADVQEREIRETEKRIREERRREIENDLIESKRKPNSAAEIEISTESRPKKETNGTRTDVAYHYIREYQYEPTKGKSDERAKFVDHNHRDYTMEFLRPSGYKEKGFEHEKYSEQESLGKSATIYKAQTIILDSQLRSSAPPLPERNESERRMDRYDRSDSERRVDRHRSKALSEARSTISEKRSGLSRDLKRKPVFSTYLTDRTAVESSRVKLTCSVLSSADPKITWYKNGVLLDDKLKYRTKFIDGLITLEVLNAVVSDSAEYTCTVENENGSVNTSATLKVYPSFEASPIPPTFTRSIRDTFHLAENELVLECRIRGQPLPTITWLKDDKPVSGNERYQAYYLADGVCRLAISSPTPEDSGQYTCKAENSVWSDQITHIVSFTGKESRLSQNIATIERSRFNRQAMESRRPHFTNVLSDYKVAKGGTIGLQVEIKGCPTRVEWLREGRNVTEVYRNARTFVEQGLYTLALSDVTEKESGTYTCRAWSTHGNVDMNAAITVVQPNELDGKPAIIVGRPEKDILISIGEDVNISFRVQGEPKPKVVFMKGTRDITTSQRVCKMTSDDYVKFTLKRSVISDAGTYCILARNAYGCDRAFVTVVVRQRASSENLISDWTYPMDDSSVSIAERKYKSVPDRIPGEPSVVDGGNNWVSLAWPKADPRDTAPVLAYKIESWLLGKEGGARWVELGITPLNSFDAFNLKQGEEYHFRVTPKNKYGWGESVPTSIPIGIGLAGDRPEFLEILPGQLKVLAGETANLSCSVKGKPVPEIVWMKNGHEIEEESRMTTLYNGQDCSLTIKDICIEDEARYSCEASNVHGRASTYARLAVVTDRLVWEADAKLKRERSQDAEGDYPPQFTMRLRDRRVQATYPVRLTCQVVGSPPPTLTWFKDGELVVFDSRRNKYQDEHFHTLEIAPTSLEDGGVYEAMARNSSGAVSCRCSLVVDKGIRAYVAPEFCCGLEPLYRLSEGDELRISAVVEAYPSVGVTWYRDGVRLRPSRRAIMTLDRDGQIELALAAVTARDAGVYTCTASNEVGRASTSGKVDVVGGKEPREKTTAPVLINAPDVPYSKEPMFVRKPRSSEAREGDTVIIACEVIGDPKPDVYWLRDFLKPDYYRDASHFKRVGDGPEYRFEIPHAKLDYTGAYSVVARNVHGEAKAIISLQILAKDPSSPDDSHNVRYGRVEVIPRFDRELTDLLSYDGDAVEFECHVTGNPEPDIRWFHYNELIRDCPDFESSFEEGAARLKIKQVTAEDEGTYSCEASNNLGKATSSACLVVYPPGEPNTLSQRLRRPPALLSAASTPRSTPRSTPARSVSRTPGPETRRLCSPSRQMAPSFYTYPFNKVVEEGDHVTFKCAVKGQPAPWATWDKDGIVITPSARFTIREKDELLRILEIEQVAIEDVGIYRITVENEFGRAEASARLEVITQKGKFYGGVRAYSASPRKSLTYRRYPSVPRQD